MPFYEYQCQGCGAHHEALQKMSDAPLKRCPDCGKSKLKRLVSAPVFRLKGGGWYETDFKSDQERKRNLHADEAAQPKTEASGADKAKPAKSPDVSKPASSTKSAGSPKATSKKTMPVKKTGKTAVRKPVKGKR